MFANQFRLHLSRKLARRHSGHPPFRPLLEPIESRMLPGKALEMILFTEFALSFGMDPTTSAIVSDDHPSMPVQRPDHREASVTSEPVLSRNSAHAEFAVVAPPSLAQPLLLDVVLGIGPPRAAGELIGPWPDPETPYLSFEDSPFNGLDFGAFYLKDWEDGVLDAPGVSALGAGLRLSSSFGQAFIDSVDADDGLINGHSHNGMGRYGEALWGDGATGILFVFDPDSLGSLPTHAGIVWTDGVGFITFVAYDQNGELLGVLFGDHANHSITGETDDDRFYGAIHSEGISAIYISNTSGGIEVDHLQYGSM